MAAFKIETTTVVVADVSATIFKIGFGDPATNSIIVRDVESRMKELEAGGIGGRLALVNGPASLPAGVVMAHHLVHRFGAVAIFDPKMAGYVVAASHGEAWSLGDVIPASEVKEG